MEERRKRRKKEGQRPALVVKGICGEVKRDG